MFWLSYRCKKIEVIGLGGSALFGSFFTLGVSDTTSEGLWLKANRVYIMNFTAWS